MPTTDDLPTVEKKSGDAPHDCSRPKEPTPLSEEMLAESYGLGQPRSEEARRERRPYFVR